MVLHYDYNQLDFYCNKKLKNVFSHHMSLAVPSWLEGLGPLSHNSAGRKKLYRFKEFQARRQISSIVWSFPSSSQSFR